MEAEEAVEKAEAEDKLKLQFKILFMRMRSLKHMILFMGLTYKKLLHNQLQLILERSYQ